MKYRIREVTLQDRTKKYYCERTGFFRRNTWRVITYTPPNFLVLEKEAIFNTLDEAKIFLGLEKIEIDSKIIYQSK